MSITTVTISNLADLIAKVTPSSPDPDSGRHRDAGVYRGAADASWPLLTSLDTLGGVAPAHSKADLEEHILRNFIRYSRPFYPGTQVNDWEVLIAAQHHGLPTRLLDWTYSPMVAAHFATVEGEADADRAVWRLDWKAVHRFFQLPARALLIQDLEGVFGQDRSFTPWTLFGAKTRERQFACMIEPPSLDARITTQAATFTLCSDNRQPFDSFLEAIGLRSALTRFVIPAQDVSRLRDQLDMVSVDERRLFPDLDGLANYLRRYYS
jgi:FRG domain